MYHSASRVCVSDLQMWCQRVSARNGCRASAKLEAGGAISKVSKEVAAEFGVAKKAVYEACLRWKSERRGGR